MKRIQNYVTLVFCLFMLASKAQVAIGNDLETIDYNSPREYEIGGMTISGTDYLDKNVLITISGLTIGDKIMVPGEKITRAIQNLWEQNLFANIDIKATKVQNNVVFLNIHVEERPRLSRFSFTGIKKGEADDLREKIRLIKGKIVTDNLVVSSQNIIKEHFVDKGFYDMVVNVAQKKDTTLLNSVIVYFNIKKNKKIKIKEIYFTGNTQIKEGKLHRLMKETKEKHWYNVFKGSKYLEENYEADKISIIDKYNEKGFRDAKIKSDTIGRDLEGLLNIKINIEEGKKYYFRHIIWVGNSKYTTGRLDTLLGIKKGDIFNQATLESRLFMSADGRDVSSLYMDEGYLFFNVTPVEIVVDNDSIDFEMRIYEGKQARVNKITVVGNTKTNDKVIMREIRTKPGQLFSRADIIRSQRELSQLRYFNAQKMGVNPKPNPADGTVDIEYVVEENPSDQIELSGGYGNKNLLITAGISFNNFSANNFFKKGAWQPLPAGDGQSLSLRAQTSGLYYQSYSASFVEPWLGGKKQNSFSVSIYHNVQNRYGSKKDDPARQVIKITGVSVGLGKRLKIPDDYFTLYNDFSAQKYKLENYDLGFKTGEFFKSGFSYNLPFKSVLSRSSIDAPIYTQSGGTISLTAQATLPYSLFNGKDYVDVTPEEKYKFIEYYKLKFSTSWFTKLVDKLVLNTRVGVGYLGNYNKTIGTSPFERFYLGGSGLSGYNLDGREIIALRGYTDGDLSPSTGASAIVKYTMELRYPFSLNPQATIFGLAFAEAGNSWSSFKEFNPFVVKRSAGAGVRIFLPMFGMLGFDYGWGFDYSTQGRSGRNVATGLVKKGEFAFTIGATIGDL